MFTPWANWISVAVSWLFPRRVDVRQHVFALVARLLMETELVLVRQQLKIKVYGLQVAHRRAIATIKSQCKEAGDTVRAIEKDYFRRLPVADSHQARAALRRNMQKEIDVIILQASSDQDRLDDRVSY